MSLRLLWFITSCLSWWIIKLFPVFFVSFMILSAWIALSVELCINAGHPTLNIGLNWGVTSAEDITSWFFCFEHLEFWSTAIAAQDGLRFWVRSILSSTSSCEVIFDFIYCSLIMSLSFYCKFVASWCLRQMLQVLFYSNFFLVSKLNKNAFLEIIIVPCLENLLQYLGVKVHMEDKKVVLIVCISCLVFMYICVK